MKSILLKQQPGSGSFINIQESKQEKQFTETNKTGQ